MREQIEIYHGIDATFELRSAFFSEKYNSCLYYYAYSQAGFTWLNIRDYFTNEIIYASDRYEYFEASTKEDEFESKLFEYQ
jgi:hypothetical protein